ncbi:hypothetical protein [Pseudomonas sp. NPDC090592]|uniref:hypothetical protein n=1 Tax=Pseudomonas sp. NPDC090592 TaxID=3364480 RepID=UPI00383B0363
MTDYAHVQSISLQAIKVFQELHDGAVLSGGPLTAPGSAGFVIDCKKTHHRLLVTTLDREPGKCALVLADLNDPNAEVNTPFEVLPLVEVSVLTLVNLMETKFAK